MPPCPAHYPDADVRTNAAHVPFARLPLLLHLYTTRACSLCRLTEQSPPILSPGAARVASTQCTTTKGGHPLHLVYTSAVSASGKLSPLRLPMFPTTSSMPSHLTHLSPRMQVPEFRQSPELLPDPKDWYRNGELRLSVVCPPRFDSAPGTVSGRCVEVHECFLWTSSRGSSSRRASQAAPRRAMCVV
jgi:hypothetical protein